MDPDELFADLAVRLRAAHRRVEVLRVDDDEKLSITRRLLAISDASKRSAANASRRLDAFLSDLESRFPQEDDG